MAAGNAGVGVDFKLSVMVARHFVARKRKVVIFVDKPYVNPCGARLAGIAVNAASDGAFGRKARYYGIVVFLA